MASYFKTEGEWGGEGGSAWTEGIHSEIKSIVIRHGFVIDAIHLDYKLHGKDVVSTVQGQQHGGNGGLVTTIKLDEGEYITKVRGHVGVETVTSGEPLVRSLTLVTNKGTTYGPYGRELGTAFESATSGKIVGFFGRSASYVISLGVYILYH